jgi:exonuclease-1
VNKYSGIAEKSMDKFAALISSFRYAGSRASGLRAPLKDVKNTLSVRYVALEIASTHSLLIITRSELVSPISEYITAQLFCYRSILKPPEQKLKCTAKKTARGHCSQSRSTSDAPNNTDSPNLRTFAYRPNKTTRSTGGCPDQGKNALKAMGTADSQPDLSTFAYTPTITASRPDRSQFSTMAVRTSDSPPDLSTFAYKAMKPVARNRESDGSRFTVTRLAASGQTSRGRFI